VTTPPRTQPGFGQRLRQARTQAGLSQAELAGDGVSASYVSLLESGRREPTGAAVAHLAQRLALDAEVLHHGLPTRDDVEDATDLAFARVCLGQGDSAQARTTATRLLTAGAFEQDPGRRFELRLVHAEAAERLGDLAAAVVGLEGLRRDAEADPARLPWLPVLVALSRCYRESGDLHRAVDLAEAALDRCDQLGLTGLAGHAQLVSTLAAAYYERGDLLRAAVLLDDLLEATRGATRADQAAAAWNASVIAVRRGHPAEGLRLAERAAALLAEGADERAIARLKITRAWVLLGQDTPDPQAARELLRAALPALLQHDSAASVGSAETELARCEVLLGRYDVAVRHARSALERLGTQHPLESSQAACAHAEALLGQGRGEEAVRELQVATEQLGAAGADRQAAAVWRRVADVHLAAGDAVAAGDAYRRALDAAGLRGTRTRDRPAAGPARSG